MFLPGGVLQVDGFIFFSFSPPEEFSSQKYYLRRMRLLQFFRSVLNSVLLTSVGAGTNIRPSLNMLITSSLSARSDKFKTFLR